MDLTGLKYLVVGAGFFGSVIAERVASICKEKVLIVEKRDHIGGNCFSYSDEKTGVECHKYGSHIFHTKEKRVRDYINRFTTFNSYQHQVLTRYKDTMYQMPINLATLNSFYGLSLKPFEVQGFLDNEIKKSIKGEPKNLEEKAISLIGRPLYEAFIRGYTLKQWGIDPVKLDAEIFNRLPVRHNYDTRYFTDPWQGIPKEGYSALFNNLLSSSKIDISLKTDYFEIRDRVPKGCTVIFTGPIDSFFDYKYGHLNWRSLRFETMYHDVADYQGTSVVNYADQEIPYTRIHEFKHYHPERRHEVDSTIVYKEFPLACTPDREPYYPVGTKEDRIHFKEYLNKASRLPNVIFGGRLGLYQYLNMDQVVLQALDTFDKKVKKKG